jgi:short-chain fatty acids transporter
MLVWHGGLSGSAPLKVTQASDLAELSVAGGVITLEQTLASPLNLTLNLALLALVPLLLNLMSPPEEGRQGFELVKGRGVSTHTQPEPPSEIQPTTPAERLERSAWLSKGLALIMLSYLTLYTTREGLNALDLNTINLLLLALGLTAHPHLKAYEEATPEAVKGCAGIILQFPLYAGVMGVMAGAGLTTALSTWVTSVASAESLSPLVFFSAGLVNLFVPSGGGQWALQGPLIIESARTLEANIGEAVMAFSYGDAWTNMLQPFWALPLLGLTGLKAKELVGYSAALMLLVTPLYLLLFWLF